MAPTIAHDRQVKEVLAKLNYHRQDADDSSNIYILGSGDSGEYDSAEVHVQNIRGDERDFILDVHGFQLLQDISSIKSSDHEYLETEHAAMVSRTIKALTGASDVLIADIRPRLRKVDNPAKPPLYSRFVHVDQSFSGARVMFPAKFPEYAAKFSSSRWAVINWWQPFSNPVTRTPLALCDCRSVPQEDWREIMARAPQARAAQVPDRGMWRVVKPCGQAEHKWYFVQEMQPDEALLIKIFDTKEQGVSRRTPHSAFETPLDYGPERTSIEWRCIVFWDD